MIHQFLFEHLAKKFYNQEALLFSDKTFKHFTFLGVLMDKLSITSAFKSAIDGEKKAVERLGTEEVLLDDELEMTTKRLIELELIIEEDSSEIVVLQAEVKAIEKDSLTATLSKRLKELKIKISKKESNGKEISVLKERIEDICSKLKEIKSEANKRMFRFSKYLGEDSSERKFYVSF